MVSWAKQVFFFRAVERLRGSVSLMILEAANQDGGDALLVLSHHEAGRRRDFIRMREYGDLKHPAAGGLSLPEGRPRGSRPAHPIATPTTPRPECAPLRVGDEDGNESVRRVLDLFMEFPGGEVGVSG